MPGKIWSVPRKLAANLIPAALCLPLAVIGVLSWKPDSPLDPFPLLLVFAMPVLGWIVLNFLGTWGNQGMRAELARLAGRKYPGGNLDIFFVGFAHPRYQSMLDPHEDVGFLIFHEEELELFSSSVDLRWSRDEILSVGRKANIHTLVGLGGWVVIKGVEESHTIYVEPREKYTLLGCSRMRKPLIAKLNAWRQNEDAPPTSRESV